MDNEKIEINNLEIFNKVREVPEKAQKKIGAGRLKGMTDIKPMWRIEKLTEVFGPVGIGWKTKTINKTIIDGANDEKIATVDIELYVKYDGENWSEPIEGSGGSSFISKEQKGLYTSDECFKMAYTDALSVACKSLGMGADVYWGDSKYASQETKEPMTKEQAENYVINFGKKHPGEKLVDVIENDKGYIDYLLRGEKTDSDVLEAIKLLTGQVPLTEDEVDEHLELTQELMGLIQKYDIDLELVCNTYKVKRITELSPKQYAHCINYLKSKYEV